MKATLLAALALAGCVSIPPPLTPMGPNEIADSRAIVVDDPVTAARDVKRLFASRDIALVDTTATASGIALVYEGRPAVRAA